MLRHLPSAVLGSLFLGGFLGETGCASLARFAAPLVIRWFGGPSNITIEEEEL
jgi:hypothetical protein